MAKNKSAEAPQPNKLDQMINQLETELTNLVKSAKETADLSKAHEGESTSPEVPPDASATSAGPPPDVSAGGPPPEGSPPMDGAPPPADASAPPPPEGGEGGEPAPTLDQIVQALAQLPPEQFAMYDQAVQQVKAQQGGAGGPPPDAGLGGPPPEGSPPAGPPDAMKSEYVASLQKAEGALKTQAATIEGLQAQLDEKTKVLAKQEAEIKEASVLIERYLATPGPRRAVTAASARPPVQGDPVASLSKGEITGRLRRAMRNRSLPDKDRTAVDNYLFKSAPLDSIKHLLVEQAAQ